MKFTLPISPSYVSHWGLWEAVRELYQNALDEHALDPTNHATLIYDQTRSALRIQTSKGGLTPASLILGNTSKTDDPTQRGKFGEGYKLALLVLARLKLPIEIINGTEVWIPRIEFSDDFGSEVLTIEIDEASEYPSHEGVEFIIGDITPDQNTLINRNIVPFFNRDCILTADSEKGRVYVGGLYVATMNGFQRGYSFKPGTVKLDRDRGMLDGFDLSYETSRLHMHRDDDGTLDMLGAEAPDVAYVEHQVARSSPIVLAQSRAYTGQYGFDAVPVSTQPEIQAATNAGLKWVLVKSQVKSILKMVNSWFIPTTKSPATRLREFKTKYSYTMRADMLDDLQSIIDQIDPPVTDLKEF